MDSVNKTLYIPLYGKAYVSRRGLILSDPKAEEIWQAGGFTLKGKSASKWLAYYMGMRSAVFDDWLIEKLAEYPEAVVLHLGCGMDSRVLRVAHEGHRWYDADFPEVIRERGKYYGEDENYSMLSADLREAGWLSGVCEKGRAIVVMEGVSMYLRRVELKALCAALAEHFQGLSLLMDCYTDFAARMSKYKNPINDVGVSEVYGLDDPRLICGAGLGFVKEREMTPRQLIDELFGMEKRIFERLYAGKMSQKLYKLYEYESV